jgi:hypothetical protein
MARELASVAS